MEESSESETSFNEENIQFQMQEALKSLSQIELLPKESISGTKRSREKTNNKESPPNKVIAATTTPPTTPIANQATTIRKVEKAKSAQSTLKSDPNKKQTTTKSTNNKEKTIQKKAKSTTSTTNKSPTTKAPATSRVAVKTK